MTACAITHLVLPASRRLVRRGARGGAHRGVPLVGVGGDRGLSGCGPVLATRPRHPAGIADRTRSPRRCRCHSACEPRPDARIHAPTLHPPRPPLRAPPSALRAPPALHALSALRATPPSRPSFTLGHPRAPLSMPSMPSALCAPPPPPPCSTPFSAVRTSPLPTGHRIRWAPTLASIPALRPPVPSRWARA